MFQQAINKIIRRKIGKEVLSLSSVGGGSISSAYKAYLSDGSFIFIKVSPQFPDMFVKEANGLRELEKANAIKIPAVLDASEEALILEYVPVSHPVNTKNFFENFGRQFAALHRCTASSFGFYEDNYIGSTPQKNTERLTSWKEFFFIQRLEFQFRLAEHNGYVDSSLFSLFNNLGKIIDGLIPNDSEPPTLLHGDLWSGNFLSLKHGQPAIIDPAVYYGHREADLAMTLLFGGFDTSFYDAYNEAYPLNKGWKFRMELYKLYHLFNHLNLFGDGYYRHVAETMKQLNRV